MTLAQVQREAGGILFEGFWYSEQVRLDPRDGVPQHAACRGRPYQQPAPAPVWGGKVSADTEWVQSRYGSSQGLERGSGGNWSKKKEHT